MTDDDTIIGPDPGRPGTPTHIGPYSIRRVVASGGMGTIYEAVQENPRRTVAVKVMRQGVASPEVLRRFEYEAQLLARLHHPGIAQVYEAGTYEEGGETFPYFAMEYIANARSITDYANERHLGVRERLELFLGVCDAVHHGHQKGIIHRDLKPGNILVDSSGHVRVIDFGVARATDADMAMTHFQTQVGQLIGSVQYMSPEQFDADPRDLDTRSDVYALGVVLYELLVGELPYDLSRTTIYDAARVVKEETPARPRTRAPGLPADVETILLTALQKDRERRYQSAFGLAQDIRRFLSGEAIVARPASVSYQIRVFARRNKLLMGALAAVALLLVAGISVSTVMYVRAESQRRIAEEQTTRAQASEHFLSEVLATVAPGEFGVEPSVRDLLGGVAEKLENAFPGDPATEAELRLTLARGYLNLSSLDECAAQAQEGLSLAREAHSRVSEETLPYLQLLGFCYSIRGQKKDYLDVQRDEYEVNVASKGESSPETIRAMYGLTAALADVERVGEAMEYGTRTLDLVGGVAGENSEETIEVLVLLSSLHLMNREADTAERVARDALDRCKGRFGPGHPVTQDAVSALAASLIEQGRTSEAATLYENRQLPETVGVVRNYQGTFEPRRPGAQVLVFWETYCPFSQRAVPALEDSYRRFHSSNLEFVGITEVLRSSTDEKVMGYIDDWDLTFPMVREDGTIRSFFGVKGTPRVVVIENGRMIWDNRLPIQVSITDGMLNGLVQAQAGP